MPNTFTTEWKKIGQSGPTMDGREIEPQWLIDAAETYDPGTYTAVIWIDHFRFYGNMGKVVELKQEKDGDVVSLYAKLQPNEWLLSYNKDKQKLFTSMELTPDFAKSGRCYLSGLAVTDIPSSLGTTELHFSHRKQNPDNLILCGVELERLRDEESEAEAPKWFTKAMQRLGINIPQKPGATPEPEEEAMNAEQFSEVMGAIKSIGDRQEALEQQFAAQPPAQDKDGTDAGGTPDTDDGKQTFSAEITEALKPINDKLGEMETAFNAKVDELTERFEKVNPGTPAPESIQPADGGKLL
jgi:hypothetical protein